MSNNQILLHNHGLTCYGCGLTRAIQHLIHFDLENALIFNKLSVVVLPILLFVWASEIRRMHRILRQKQA